MHPLVLVEMLIAIILMLILPRKYVIVPFLFCVFLVPMGQQLTVGGLHFFVSRILILVGCFRMMVTSLTSQESMVGGGFNSIDGAFFCYVFVEAAAVSLQYMQSQAVFNQIGFLIDFAAAYLLIRAWIRDESDVYRAIKCFAALTVILGISMVFEQLTLHNVFGMLGGGVRATPEIREGKIRSQGVFQHSILAGTFAASLLPLFLLLWKNGKAKFAAAMGLVGCTVMTICSNSSTPLLTYAAAVLAVCLWPLRKNMRIVRWAIVGAIAALALVMKAPVWFILSHIDLTGGSSGYQRATLVDSCIRHFWDWWLIGSKDVPSWGYDLWDQQNQYVNVAETGGLLAFIFFIAMISRSFGRLGKSRKLVDGDKDQEWRLWFLGAALFANCTGFFGVNYFDQTKISWFVLLATISAVTAPILARSTVPEAYQSQPGVSASRLELNPSYQVRAEGVVRNKGNALPPVPKPARGYR